MFATCQPPAAADVASRRAKGILGRTHAEQRTSAPSANLALWEQIASSFRICVTMSTYIFLCPRQPREVATRFRKTLTLLLLAMGLGFAPSARAHGQDAHATVAVRTVISALAASPLAQPDRLVGAGLAPALPAGMAHFRAPTLRQAQGRLRGTPTLLGWAAMDTEGTLPRGGIPPAAKGLRDTALASFGLGSLLPLYAAT